jgi:hypothetical protein
MSFKTDLAISAAFSTVAAVSIELLPAETRTSARIGLGTCLFVIPVLTSAIEAWRNGEFGGYRFEENRIVNTDPIKDGPRADLTL